MCGRYTITVTLEDLLLRYQFMPQLPQYHLPRYNVAPGQMIVSVIHDGQQNRVGELRWGLVPSWAKDESSAFRMINARAETIEEKPSFRPLFERKRCLIPADGFYEWKKSADGKSKQPMRFKLKQESIFSMAGLYDTWVAPDGRKISTCTIITTTPNRLVADVHDRMPVILRPDQEAEWLDRGNRDTVALRSMLKPYPAEEMFAYPVSSAVGNVRNDGPECIEEWAHPAADRGERIGKDE